MKTSTEKTGLTYGRSVQVTDLRDGAYIFRGIFIEEDEGGAVTVEGYHLDRDGASIGDRTTLRVPAACVSTVKPAPSAPTPCGSAGLESGPKHDRRKEMAVLFSGSDEVGTYFYVKYLDGTTSAAECEEKGHPMTEEEARKYAPEFFAGGDVRYHVPEEVRHG